MRKENLLARYTKWISSEATYQKSLFVFVGKLVFRKVCMPRPQNIRGLNLFPYIALRFPFQPLPYFPLALSFRDGAPSQEGH